MPNVIEITRDFPPTRERTVLIEMLRVVSTLQQSGINLVVCGGWVIVRAVTRIIAGL